MFRTFHATGKNSQWTNGVTICSECRADQNKLPLQTQQMTTRCFVRVCMDRKSHPGVNPGGGGHGGWGNRPAKRGTAWFFFPNAEHHDRRSLNGYWTQASASGAAFRPASRRGGEEKEAAGTRTGHQPPSAPPVFYIRGTNDSLSIVCVDGGAVRPYRHFPLPHSFPHNKLISLCGTGRCL